MYNLCTDVVTMMTRHIWEIFSRGRIYNLYTDVAGLSYRQHSTQIVYIAT
jgi:hypothetical protein